MSVQRTEGDRGRHLSNWYLGNACGKLCYGNKMVKCYALNLAKGSSATPWNQLQRTGHDPVMRHERGRDIPARTTLQARATR